MVSGISSSFSTASLTEMRQNMFNKIDTNGDGSIDKSEMTAVMQQNSESLIDNIFGKLDTNKDGLISQIESDSGLAKLGQQMKQGGTQALSGKQPPPPPEKVFDAADTNKDGVVTQEELKAVMGDNGGSIDDLFGKVDTDGDGVISRAEDEAFREKMPEKMQQKGASSSVTGSDISELTQSWQSGMLTALIQSLTASVGSSSESTSVYA